MPNQYMNGRTMIAVDEKLHRRLKAYAALLGLTLQEATDMLLEQILSQKKNEQNEFQAEAA